MEPQTRKKQQLVSIVMVHIEMYTVYYTHFNLILVPPPKLPARGKRVKRAAPLKGK